MPVYTLSINNKLTKITAEADMPLVWAIRDFAGLKGTKFGCGIAQCGACTVHIDGQPVRSCQMPLSAISKKAKITTVEGIGEKTLHAVQKAWIEEQVPQCGYCQSGQIMTAVALLNTNKNPNDADILAAMEGNLCRCGTYQRINNAIKNASKAL
jgi:isoquinoline 1-oxidoreductase subunit alpha